MKSRAILAAAALAAWSGASAVSAAPVIVEFSFTDLAGGEFVTGVVRGLVDDKAGQEATSVEVLTNSHDYGVGTYVAVPGWNYWSVSGGLVTGASFLSRGPDGAPPEATMAFDSNFGMIYGAIHHGTGGYEANDQSLVTFTVTAVPLPVPLPATLPLAAVALGGLGLIARRRRVT